MKKWNNFQYILMLMVGGIFFCFFMGYPQRVYGMLFPANSTTIENQQETEQESSELQDIDTLVSDVLDVDDQATDEQNTDTQVTDVQDTGTQESDVQDTDVQVSGEQNTDTQEPGVQNTDDQESDVQASDDQSFDEQSADAQETDSVPSSVQQVTPVHDFQTVGDEYFSDAVFIGDSRTVSLYDYAGWEDATYYCSSGMRLDGVFGEPNRKFKDGNWKENIGDALQTKQFAKVYIMLGINDMGVGDLAYFEDLYRSVIDKIREWQPDAIIYIQGIMRVSTVRSNKGDYINNQAIIDRNEILKTFDNGRDIIYLDVNEVVCDEAGGLTAEYTFDGVHLYAKYVYLWTDYLKEHAIVR